MALSIEEAIPFSIVLYFILRRKIPIPPATTPAMPLTLRVPLEYKLANKIPSLESLSKFGVMPTSPPTLETN